MKFRGTLILALMACSVTFATALELKDVTFDTKGAGKVVFSHNAHLKKKAKKTANISCKACHNANMRLNVRYTMADMEKGKSCGMCHNGKTAFTISKCTECHKVRDITYKVKETGPVAFSHTKHLKTMQCNSCHTKLYLAGPNNKHVSMAEMEKGKSCGACHNGKKAFDIGKCATCHPVKEITFKVKETGPTHFSHKKHIEMYKCGDCHSKLYAAGPNNKRVSMAEMEKGKSCGACHNAKDAFAVADCAKCHPVKEVDFKLKDIGNVKFSHTFHLGMYKCGECHTGIYRPSSGNKAVSMTEMEQGKSCGACHDGKSAFTVKENCDKCHK
ncbi:MAG: hypothetical protein FD174_1876 [Geobacteraceae bacterium]|nr:MAG: hypothetical protein FD174_1876 [Geobacteraceae bacterium]